MVNIVDAWTVELPNVSTAVTVTELVLQALSMVSLLIAPLSANVPQLSEIEKATRESVCMSLCAPSSNVTVAVRSAEADWPEK